MSSRSFFVQKTKNLHSRYKISTNAQRILKSLDDYHMGSIEEGELGRLVRLSPNMRKALTETISKCATMMEKKPDEVKDCVAIIQNCTEILQIADESTVLTGFPFMKCPKEIRVAIYEQYINRISIYKLDKMVPFAKKSGCFCAGHDGTYHHKVSLGLPQVSKAIREEFLTVYYSRQTFHFSCACDLEHHLASNELLRATLRSVKVHWSGPDPAKAFKTLANCSELRKVEIVISKATTSRVTKRQGEMNRFFTSQQRTPRLTDALGMDELMEIRNLVEVKVSHILSRQGFRRTDEEKANLQALLTSKLLQR